jgi:hypothetical protein
MFKLPQSKTYKRTVFGGCALLSAIPEAVAVRKAIKRRSARFISESIYRTYTKGKAKQQHPWFS